MEKCETRQENKAEVCFMNNIGSEIHVEIRTFATQSPSDISSTRLYSECYLASSRN